MSNDISTDVQYIKTIGGKKCQMILLQMYNDISTDVQYI